jgi:DNA (cytosine-5)-methyltransferase 1
MKSTLCDNNWLKEDQAPNYHTFEQRINIVDLFAGCGGLTLGALEACYHNKLSSQIQLAVEYNDTAANTYKSNFLNDEAQLYKGNIEDLITNNPGDPLSNAEISLQKKIQNVDILLAGPPCQGHSRLNNHTRSTDPRNKLYLKVVRFVELCKPQFVIIENVLNIKYDADSVLKTSAFFLKQLGYHVNNITVKTVEYGIAQNRVRHIQVASLEALDISLTQYKSSSVLKNVIDDIMDDDKHSKHIFDTPSVTKHQERIEHLFDHELYDLPDELRPDCHKHKKHTYYTSYGRL